MLRVRARNTTPFGTGQFGTGPFGTGPFCTGPFGIEPFGTRPFSTVLFGTNKKSCCVQKPGRKSPESPPEARRGLRGHGFQKDEPC